MIIIIKIKIIIIKKGWKADLDFSEPMTVNPCNPNGEKRAMRIPGMSHVYGSAIKLHCLSESFIPFKLFPRDNDSGIGIQTCSLYLSLNTGIFQ